MIKQISNTKHKKTPSPATLQAAILCYQKGRYDAAVNQARSLVRKYPLHAGSWKLLGTSLQALGQPMHGVGSKTRIRTPGTAGQRGQQ